MRPDGGIVRVFLLSLVCLAACDRGYVMVCIPPQTPLARPGKLIGRVCGDQGWVEGALASTELLHPNGNVIGVRRAWTDRNGWWMLADLPADREYTVIVQDGDRPASSFAVFLPPGHAVTMPEPRCFDGAALSAVVVTDGSDAMADVLADIGVQADVVDADDPDARARLSDPSERRRYRTWFLDSGAVDPAALRAFVDDGGVVWASGSAANAVVAAWPRPVQLGAPVEGHAVRAAVVDEPMAARIGTADLDLDGVEQEVVGVASSVSVHVAASSQVDAAPLLVSFNSGDGRVFYSAFPLAGNPSDAALTYLLMTYAE